MRFTITYFAILFVLPLSYILSGCVNIKKLSYIQNADTTLPKEMGYYEPVIVKGDILSILVTSPDQETNTLFNQANGIGGGMNGGAGAGINIAGYLVDINGNIDFPLLGLIHVAGMSKSMLRETLQKELLSFVSKPPVVNVRYMNYRVNIIGEVAAPGIYTTNNERLNIVEAVALAGNLTNYGRRDNILIIREEGGQRISGRIDLGSADVFNSPFFYLKQNDIVIVDMNRNKVTWSDQGLVRNISTIGGLVGTIGLIITLALTLSK